MTETSPRFNTVIQEVGGDGHENFVYQTPMHINVFEDSVISDAKEKVQVNVSQGKLRAKKPFYKD